ncbi:MULTISPECIES: LysR family transcriptional regulator [unclassified Janthinobacterium]|uniref:LysR family transcriptional regulator n=1 Tax=unclassified Janthinobacterium TaxID=2610881 RepID=UPI0018CB455B|nr:LysR family transcriptional regulator [Janthinobacterium sp. CG_23.4]MDH6156338.1 DNA-binding transcriptional LysR family regulator [Janthinobacterium sp. CG_23.4]
MDQLTTLRALRRVVELGSFTAAGAALGISHSIVSRQIRQLESQLGAQLLNRTTRRFALTAAGREYYLASRDILDALDAADRAVAMHQAQPSGCLRINAPTAFGTLELAAWLPAFTRHYPHIHIDLVCNDRIVDLLDDGFDVALRLARGLPDSTLVARQLASSRTLAVASPAYLARHGHPATPQDLAQHNCLMYTAGDKPAEWLFTDAGGSVHKVAVRGSLQANTSIALREAAVGGMGIAGAAAFIVRDALRSGKLLEVLPGYTLRPRTLYALYPHSRQLSPKVRAFVDFAVQHYQDRYWD